MGLTLISIGKKNLLIIVPGEKCIQVRLLHFDILSSLLSTARVRTKYCVVSVPRNMPSTVYHITANHCYINNAKQ